jgi:hypothetical protein
MMNPPGSERDGVSLSLEVERLEHFGVNVPQVILVYSYLSICCRISPRSARRRHNRFVFKKKSLARAFSYEQYRLTIESEHALSIILSIYTKFST